MVVVTVVLWDHWKAAWLADSKAVRWVVGSVAARVAPRAFPLVESMADVKAVPMVGNWAYKRADWRVPNWAAGSAGRKVVTKAVQRVA